MSWPNTSMRVPIEHPEFTRLIDGFVFNCPSRIVKETKIKPPPITGPKYRREHENVSKRKCSFYDRGIKKDLLTTILAQIRRPMVANGTYIVLKPEKDVEHERKLMESSITLSDDFYDEMIYHTRTDMSDTEAIFYYVRNAFAHGSFEAVSNGASYIYILESQKDDTIKAQMRLKEETLLHYLELANASEKEIRSMQRRKKAKK